MSDQEKKTSVVPKAMLIPFILVTCLFALWGFANDITNPLVKAFKDVFVISNAQSSFVQMAFYGGYATMAIPAALFIRKFSYKAGILVGLALYATGALLSIPAASLVNFNLFLAALYVLTFGLAFLETTANPYILSMGDEATATRRLNLAQAFNPIGSLTGMTVAIFAILSNLQVQEFRDDVAQYRAERAAEVRVVETSDVVLKAGIVDNLMSFLKLDADNGLPVDESLAAFLNVEEAKRNAPVTIEQMALVEAKTLELDADKASLADIGYNDVLSLGLKAYKSGEIESFRGKPHGQMQVEDLKVVRAPYVAIGLVVLVFFVVFLISKMPNTGKKDEQVHMADTLKKLGNARYIGGVIAQTAYVAAQIMCWTFIIHYATDLLGFSFAKAQTYNVIAMIFFCTSRFICTFLLKFFSPGHLLMSLAIGAMALTLGAIFVQGMPGLYCLVGISACMSLMFPTIYGIALDGMGEEAKVASAGLIFAIVGGCLMPPLQGRIIDAGGIGALESVRVSFFLPFICFIVIAIYGFLTFKVFHPPSEDKYTKA